MPLPTNVLIIGSGGREHTLVRSCLASPAKPRVIGAPGNAGIAEEVPCFAVAADDIAGLVDLAQREKVDFVIVGPEVPLALGVVDRLLEVGVPLERSLTAREVAGRSIEYVSPAAQARLYEMVPLVTAALYAPSSPPEERAELMAAHADA